MCAMLGVAGAALHVLQIGLDEDLLQQSTSCRFAVIKSSLQKLWSYLASLLARIETCGAFIDDQ